MSNQDRIAIEFISVLGMPPVDFVTLAAELGVHNIGFALSPFTANPHNYPMWSLRENDSLRQEMGAALKANGVSISLGEGFLVRAGADIADMARDMDIMVELGARRVNTISIEPERNRNLEQFGTFADMAAARGLEATIEFMPGCDVGSLADALAVVEAVGRPNLRVLVDAMHLARSGSTPADLAAADPARIGYFQLCDVPLVSTYESYGEEARDNRMAPGEGELPLAAYIAALPSDVMIGLEVPMTSKALDGQGAKERLAPAIASARALLADAMVD